MIGIIALHHHYLFISELLQDQIWARRQFALCKELRISSKKDPNLNLRMSFISCMMLGKLLNFNAPQLRINATYLRRMRFKWNRYIKYLACNLIQNIRSRAGRDLVSFILTSVQKTKTCHHHLSAGSTATAFKLVSIYSYKAARDNFLNHKLDQVSPCLKSLNEQINYKNTVLCVKHYYQVPKDTSKQKNMVPDWAFVIYFGDIHTYIRCCMCRATKNVSSWLSHVWLLTTPQLRKTLEAFHHHIILNSSLAVH